MPVSYLHGVETIVQNNGPVPVSTVKTAVIGLVGIAPIGATNSLIAVNSKTDAAQFGSPVPGFNIPQAIAAIQAQGGGSILVVNIFDPTIHTAQITAEAKTPTLGKLKLAHAPIGTVTVLDNAGDPSGLVLDQDYSIDAYGNFVALSANVVNGTPLKFTYKYLDPEEITSGGLIGTYDAGSGVRTGMQLFDIAKNLYGYNPKIIISPVYSEINAVAAEMAVKAEAYKAIALFDAPYGIPLDLAIESRGVGGEYNFNYSSNRVGLLYPYLRAYDTATDSSIDVPYSAYMAGVIAATDINDGYWNSPSNKAIKGITGVSRDISAGANDATSDANQLNEAGIITVFNAFGTGIRTWGNRSSAFPTITTPDNFIAVQRTADVVHESLENAALQFVDKPITPVLRDIIRETGNGFIRTLIQRGALLPGSRIEYDAAKNPPEELAAGHITFDIVFMVPTPAERITFNSFIDISLLASI